MAGVPYVDVAAGKPTEVQLQGDFLSHSIDLLWRYRISWITLDRFTSNAVSIEAPGTEIASPVDRVETSIDGNTFQRVETRAIILSDKGSLGTHRSVQLLFPSDVVARFVRIRYVDTHWNLRLRISIRQSLITASEGAKLNEKLPVDNSSSMNARPIRASILGDSNSVMRYGWARGLASSGVKLIENASLGSSSNAILASRLSRLTDTPIDVLLISSIVNDYVPIRDGHYNLELCRQYIRHIQAWCRKTDTVPLFILYPHRRGIDDALKGRQALDHEAFTIELCEDVGIPYFNGFAVEREMRSIWNREATSLYRDEAHLNNAAAQAMGAVIGSSAWFFWQKLQIAPQGSDGYVDRLTHDFLTIPVAPPTSAADHAPGTSTRTISTSIVDQEFLTLSAQSRVAVPVPENWEIVGYTINARRSNCSVKIEGENSVTRRADFKGYEGKDGYPFVCTRSLLNPVVPKGERVWITCERPADWHETDEIAHESTTAQAIDSLECEISELIARERDRKSTYRRFPTSRLDATRSLSQTFPSHDALVSYETGRFTETLPIYTTGTSSGSA